MGHNQEGNHGEIETKRRSRRSKVGYYTTCMDAHGMDLEVDVSQAILETNPEDDRMQEALQMLEHEGEGGFGIDEGDDSKNENNLEDAGIDLEEEESQEVFLINATILQKVAGGFLDRMRIF